MVIYKTTNLQTGKIYIGKDKYNNPKYLGSGVKLKDAIKSYGRDKFSKIILEHCSSYEDLNIRESYWIQFYNSTNPEIGYNISTGGDGGDNFTNHPNKEEYRKKLQNNARQRKPHKSTPEQIEKMRLKKLGSSWGHHSEESKQKISRSQIGKKE